MYGSPSQSSGQWNPNGPPPTTQPGQQQQWSPQPPNGLYTPRRNQIPPISQALPQSHTTMQTLQPQHPPQHPDQYRLPPPIYSPSYPQQGHQMGYAPQQPAPRQRTAIACRYCRRRKIRCSGFDTSEDGRCTNCVRFSQECVFTPVSAQTQAFVPAHTLWRSQPGQQGPPGQPGQPVTVFGPYGEKLPPHQQLQYQQQWQYPQQTPGYHGQPSYSPHDQGPPSDLGRKRASDEPHTPTLPPPNPGAQATPGAQQHREGQPYSYPDPTGLNPAGASPAFSAPPYPYAPPPTQPYYAPVYVQAGRASPHSTLAYDVQRTSSSPHPLGQQPGIPIREGRSSPASAAANAQRLGVNKVIDLVAHAKREKRTTTDSTMVQALNRGPL